MVGVVALLAAAVLALNFWLTDTSPSSTDPTDISRVRDVVGIVQGFVWAFLIVAGGIFAYRKLQLFRDFEPHLTITQVVTHRAVGTEYTHIAVTATLHNSSKVKVEIRDAFCRIYQIQPISNEEVERLYIEARNDVGDSHIEWVYMDEVIRRLGRNDLVIEPGEQHREVCEFIISKDVQSAMIYSYFYNTRFSEHSRSAQGWTDTTFHDMLPNNQQSDGGE